MPRLFEGGVEQNINDPASRAITFMQDDLLRQNTMRQDLTRQLGSVGGIPGTSEAERQMMRRSMIDQHNRSMGLSTDLGNMGRGLYTDAQRSGVGQYGLDPTLGGGAVGRELGIRQQQANTDAYRNSPEFMRRQAEAAGLSALFQNPNQSITSAGQVSQILRDAVAGGMLGGSSAMGQPQAGTPPAPAAANGAPPAPLIFEGNNPYAVNESPAARLGREIEATAGLGRPAAAQGRPAPPDMTPGELIARVNRAFPGRLGNPQAQQALDAYLRQRYGQGALQSAGQGVHVSSLAGPIARDSGMLAGFGHGIGGMLRLGGHAPWTDDLEGRALYSTLLQGLNGGR